MNTLNVLITAFVMSNLDEFNSLLYSISNYVFDKLQKIQNFAAKVVSGAGKCYINLHLKRLHWLPVKFRIHYMMFIIVYKCLNSLPLNYLCDLIEWYRPSRCLKSEDKLMLSVSNILKIGWVSALLIIVVLFYGISYQLKLESRLHWVNLANYLKLTISTWHSTHYMVAMWSTAEYFIDTLYKRIYYY